VYHIPMRPDATGNARRPGQRGGPVCDESPTLRRRVKPSRLNGADQEASPRLDRHRRRGVFGLNAAL